MKTILLSLALLLGLGAMPRPQANQSDEPLGGLRFAPYDGLQVNWPLTDNARVIQDHAVPIYLGLPMKKYYLMGRIYVPRGGGARIVRQGGPLEDVFSEMIRQRDCASLARQVGGNAVLVTDHSSLLKAFNLTKDELERTAPLLANRDKLVLVIQFESELARK